MASELIEAIEAQDGDRVASLVAAQPELAEDRNESGVSALMYAHYYGVDSTPIRAARRSPLDVFEAATVGDIDRLRELLDEDPELARARSVDAGTALHFAAFFGQSAAANFLLERGADPHAVSATFGGVTPLHSAAAARNRETVRALLAAGADPNARQQGGFTAIHAAAQNGELEMLDDLLAAGADATASTDDGRVAADFAGV
ncbi:MAG TPA: ankyrin repeat domain-containing protein [Gaiellaceae bacterium]|nr:ankyrin repeat domain-containing protein [Gaiellaceae bacterium]